MCGVKLAVGVGGGGRLVGGGVWWRVVLGGGIWWLGVGGCMVQLVLVIGCKGSTTEAA